MNEVYLNLPEFKKDRVDNIQLHDQSKVQHTQFVKNNITMANNWLGSSGDDFLFVANVISAYLIYAMDYYNQKANAIDGCMVAFKDLDKALSENKDLELG